MAITQEYNVYNLPCRVCVEKRWSICNAVTCRWRAQLVRSRRDVGSGKQEEPYSCALVVTSTEAIRLAFSGENISNRRQDSSTATLTLRS